jgi:NitT/TauT family transport system substrate-binding protein
MGILTRRSNMISRSTKLIGILVMSLTLLFMECGHRKTFYKPKIGYIKVSSCLPFFVAIENGYFKDMGIDLEPVVCANSNEGSNAMVSGQLDGIVGFGLSTLFSIEENSPGQFQIYLPCAETQRKYVNCFLVSKDSPISTISQLKGKKIGTYEGTSLLKVLELILAKFMDPEKDVTLIQVAMPLQIQALQNKQFDALFTIEPYVTIAVSKNIARVLEENPRVKYVLNPFPAGANAFSTKFINRYPELSMKILEAQVKAVDFINSNEDSAKRILPKYVPIEPEIAVESNIYEWWKPEQVDKEAIQKYADLLTGLKLLGHTIDTKKLFFETR